MRTLKPFLVAFVAAFLTASLASAQQQTVIIGNDPTDAGVLRRVMVDSQGRIVIAGGTTDGGITVAVPYCTTTASKNTTVSTSSTAVPATKLSGRWMVRVCNSPRNAGTPIVTCTSDGTTPTTASTSAGESLEVSDCATYTTNSTINCISDTASTAVTSEECK